LCEFQGRQRIGSIGGERGLRIVESPSPPWLDVVISRCGDGRLRVQPGPVDEDELDDLGIRVGPLPVVLPEGGNVSFGRVQQPEREAAVAGCRTFSFFP
jgi:hypothetical protein